MPETMLTRLPLRLLILDCDGVLIDSEPPSSRLVAQECRAMGLDITDAKVMHRFAGMTLRGIAAELEAQDNIFMPAGWIFMPAGWPNLMQKRLVALLEQEAVPIDGAHDLLTAVAALGLAVRVASNSSHEEMAVKFRRTGLDQMLRGRLHSAGDVTRPKPWPDLFLSAAAAKGVDPGACLVVEDSDTGLRAAQAAGMACVVLRAAADQPISPEPGEQSAPIGRIDHLSALGPILLGSMRSGASS